MEKTIVKKYHVTWKEASDALKLVKKSLGITGINAAEQETLVSAASEIIKAEKVKKQIENARTDRKVCETFEHCFSLTIDFNRERKRHNYTTLNQPRDVIPKKLELMGVNLVEWKLIHDTVLHTLAPVIVRSKEISTKTKNQISNYARNEATTYEMSEDGRERKMFMLINCSNHAHTNLHLVASNVLAKLNYLLSSHDILVQLKHEEIKLYPQDKKDYFREAESMYPIGLDFIKITEEHRQNHTSVAYAIPEIIYH